MNKPDRLALIRAIHESKHSIHILKNVKPKKPRPRLPIRNYPLYPVGMPGTEISPDTRRTQNWVKVEDAKAEKEMKPLRKKRKSPLIGYAEAWERKFR